MNKKIIIQLILFFIILLLVILLAFKYSTKVNVKTPDIKKIIISSDLKESSSNVINNIEYSSNDEKGNQYSIKAEYGRVSDKDSNIIIMRNVKAQVIFNIHEKITIDASSATYNTVSYDTNFKDNIIIKYDKNKITCDNVDLLFLDQKIKLYNNINYNNLNTNLIADGMEIDLLTKNSKIYMHNKDKKINVIYRSNGDN
tara:strand:+ start:1158 stop:1754 length:597 start_codon:yes stop_codon:yes gene_type:complete